MVVVREFSEKPLETCLRCEEGLTDENLRMKKSSKFCLFVFPRVVESLLHYYSLVGLTHHKRARAIKRERERERERERREERGSSEREERRSPAREERESRVIVYNREEKRENKKRERKTTLFLL